MLTNNLSTKSERKIMETKEIELKLTVAEVNGVLSALGQMPFAQVSTLIQKIQQQAAPQVQAFVAPAEE
jgi:hypothetical protein